VAHGCWLLAAGCWLLVARLWSGSPGEQCLQMASEAARGFLEARRAVARRAGLRSSRLAIGPKRSGADPQRHQRSDAYPSSRPHCQTPR
jgi:hypothetical protein